MEHANVSGKASGVKAIFHLWNQAVVSLGRTGLHCGAIPLRSGTFPVRKLYLDDPCVLLLPLPPVLSLRELTICPFQLASWWSPLPRRTECFFGGKNADFCQCWVSEYRAPMFISISNSTISTLPLNVRNEPACCLKKSVLLPILPGGPGKGLVATSELQIVSVFALSCESRSSLIRTIVCLSVGEKLLSWILTGNLKYYC